MLSAFSGDSPNRIKDLAAAFWSFFGTPFTQFALMVDVQSDSAAVRASLKGRKASSIFPKPTFEMPPLKTLLASTKPDAAVPNAPMAPRMVGIEVTKSGMGGSFRRRCWTRACIWTAHGCNLCRWLRGVLLRHDKLSARVCGCCGRFKSLTRRTLSFFVVCPEILWTGRCFRLPRRAEDAVARPGLAFV